MTMRRAVVAAGLLAVALVVLAAAIRTHEGGARRARSVTIVRVVDGDTVVAHLPGGDERVRLIGIDTPETVDPRKAVQCFGPEASTRTKQLLPKGTVIRLERDAEARDRFGRLLAYVYRAGDGTFVNLALAEEGFAHPLTIAPNVAYADRFAAAVADARAAGRGLWSACK